MRNEETFLIEPREAWIDLLKGWAIPEYDELWEEFVWVQQFGMRWTDATDVREYLLGSAKLRFLVYVLSQLSFLDIPHDAFEKVCDFDEYFAIRRLSGQFVHFENVQGDLDPKILPLLSARAHQFTDDVRDDFLNYVSRFPKPPEN